MFYINKINKFEFMYKFVNYFTHRNWFWVEIKVIDFVPTIVLFFTTTRHTGFTYRYTGFILFWISKNKKVFKCKNLKFYSNLYITGRIWPKYRYRPVFGVQTGIWLVQSRTLTCTLFWPVRYGIYNYSWNRIWAHMQDSFT